MDKVLFTIGYEGLDQERLTGALRDAGCGLLADVRAVANSRKRGFSKGALKAGIEEAGLTYVHLRGLGTPKEGREAARVSDGKRGHCSVPRRGARPPAAGRGMGRRVGAA